MHYLFISIKILFLLVHEKQNKKEIPEELQWAVFKKKLVGIQRKSNSSSDEVQILQADVLINILKCLEENKSGIYN